MQNIAQRPAGSSPSDGDVLTSDGTKVSPNVRQVLRSFSMFLIAG